LPRATFDVSESAIVCVPAFGERAVLVYSDPVRASAFIICRSLPSSIAFNSMMSPPTSVILLVDDVPDHVRQYERALRASHVRVVVVNTAGAALTAVQLERPSCAVIDERLPDMDGWDLCRAFKSDERSKTLPIILLTQQVSRAAAGKSTEAGCSAWMAHPATADDLVRAVDYVLRSDQSSPASSDEALLGVRVCVACGAEAVRATLRVAFIQYYGCRSCGFRWRIDVAPSVTE
jgi:CheY-like chemotaxis protein